MPEAGKHKDRGQSGAHSNINDNNPNSTQPEAGRYGSLPATIAPGQFLRDIYGFDNAPNVWVCSFPPGPEQWFGGRYSRVPGLAGSNNNNYFAIGLLGPGEDRRSSAGVISHHVVFADDIGTKVGRDKWDAVIAMGFPEPRFKIETSPGNETWVWVIDKPVLADDAERVRSLRVLREALGRLGLSDPLPDDARYIRMPCGINSKQKYLEAYGMPVPVRLVEWNLGTVLDLELGCGVLLGSDWKDKSDEDLGLRAGAGGGSSIAGALTRTADMNDPEPIILLGQAVGLNPVQMRAGVVEAICPNADAHTTRADTGFAFLGGGLMECSHAHCQHLRTPDFKRMMCESFDEQQNAREAMGLKLLDGGRTGVEFLARASFDYEDRKAGRTPADLLDEAGRVAAGQASAAANSNVKPRTPPAAQVALDRLLAAGAEFFHSPDDKAWIRLDGRVHYIDERKGCRAVEAWSARSGLTLIGSARSDLKDLMVARAYTGPKVTVHFRQADGSDPTKPEAVLNLMDGNGTAVHVNASGWRVDLLSSMPVTMADRAKAQPLPVPIRANDGVSYLDRLSRHIPLEPVHAQNDPNDVGTQQRAALLAFTCSQISRSGPVPHLQLTGPNGSGKTTTGRRLKGHTDPDSVDVVTSLPSDESALYAIAEQQSALIVDNVSSVRNDLSDVLAALSTGAGHQRRELYTDGGRAVFRAKTSLILTTIRDDLMQRPDLAQRTLPLHTPVLDPTCRKPEKELNRDWEADQPYLLAGLLDAVAGGFARFDAVQLAVDTGLLPALPRLADAALLAEAAAQGLGWPPGLCLNAIHTLQRGEANRQLEDSPYAYRVRSLLDREGGAWSGTVAQLMELLRFNFPDGPGWGSGNNSPQAFTSMVDRMAAPLREAWGITTTRTRSHGTRRIKLERVP
ncbi:hypothetical protein [Pseudaminobacter sp. NGMCC 1.201702]|uniref:hypothetical protein n=1 Tax=Pseudaminobacter sp. NGMCC 1.201702 TaxID=3391825 RepID=UPI0039F08183